MIFWTKYAQKGYLLSKTEKLNTTNWILHIQISLGTKFHLKKFWILGTNLPKKSISSRKQKSGTFACVCVCYLKSEHHHWILHIWITHFFLQATLFFNSTCVSELFMNWAPNVAFALLTTNNRYYTETHFTFSRFGLDLFILYLCDLFFIFSNIFIVINHMTTFKQTYLFVARFFRISPIIFGW